jgi:hypothetical protein
MRAISRHYQEITMRRREFPKLSAGAVAVAALSRRASAQSVKEFWG